MRAVMIGCVESSAIFLQTLLEAGADIVGVITKKESGYNADFVDLAGLAEENEIPYIYVNHINDQAADFIRGCRPDIGFCLGWSQLLKKEVLQMFPQGVVGFHPAALPHNRGRHPLIWALALGLEETASSFFMLDEGADTGHIVSQERVLITYEDTARTLYDKVMETAKRQLKGLWTDICAGNILVPENDACAGNVWRKRGRADGKIDWRMSGRNIYNLVRALSEPYVGAHFEHDGCEYKVWEVRELDDSAYKNIEPGKIVKAEKGQSFTVKTGSGLIEVLRYDRSFLPKIGMYL